MEDYFLKKPVIFNVNAKFKNYKKKHIFIEKTRIIYYNIVK